ncbi:MAG: NAD(P)-dependent dehydrogenase (short-subunit alcohol dehydrogenase family) [Halieaceae bacterium]|jgi:NAD(P)-dependent dehydrogenase (short-subunit alcohol dehydrogenase family)
MAFHGKVALVTGGASGMGREAALQLAGSGARVAIVDLNEKALASTAAENELISSYSCDVSNLESVQALVTRIESELGPIDRLTHCAAIMPAIPLMQSSAVDVNKMMAINYGGTVNMVQTIMPLMQARGSGDVIMFGSMAGDIPSLTLGAYCASKAATNMYAEILYHENRDGPVRMVLVCPPAVDTPLMDQAVDHGPAALIKDRAEGRMATPKMIIDAIETGIEDGKWVVRPGNSALYTRFRHWFPGLLWRLVHKSMDV